MGRAHLGCGCTAPDLAALLKHSQEAAPPHKFGSQGLVRHPMPPFSLPRLVLGLLPQSPPSSTLTHSRRLISLGSLLLHSSAEAHHYGDMTFEGQSTQMAASTLWWWAAGK